MSLSWNCTYIDRSFFLSVQFSKLHLYRSVIHLFSLVWGFFGDYTYIDRSFVLSVYIQFELGPHLYRSVTHLVSSVWVLGIAPISIGHFNEISVLETTPISISHFHEISVFGTALILIDHFHVSSVFGTAPISIGHSLVDSSSSQGRIYIDWSFVLLVCVQFELGLHLYRSVIVLSVQFEFLGSHLYQSAIFLPVCIQFEFFRTASISVGHSSCQFSFWNNTYIDLSSSYQFDFRFLGSHPYRSAIFLSSCVRF